MIDLHVHSNYSDGSYEPAKVIENAVRDGLDAVALCDHDCIWGLAEARIRAKELGIEFIPGVELSVSINGDPDHASEIHILGLFIHATDHLEDIHARVKKAAEAYSFDLAEAIRKNYKMPVFVEDMRHMFRSTINVGAVVHYLLQKKFIKDAADWRNMVRQLETEGKTYKNPGVGISVEEAIQAIHEAGGLTILAHPYRMGLANDVLFKRLKQYKAKGLDGVETYYTNYGTHSKSSSQEVASQNQKALAMAKELNLLVSGGSDYHHDENKGRFQGQQGVPNKVLPSLKKAWKARTNNKDKLKVYF